ncbi:Single-stranded DNA-binding protein [Rhodanobacter lindaniclasticus]
MDRQELGREAGAHPRHRIKIFGRLGEIANEYLKKGRQVYIEGSIRTDKFTGKDGVEKYFTDIIANEMQMLGSNEGGGGGGGYQRERPQGGQRQGGGNYGGQSRGNDDRGSSRPRRRHRPTMASRMTRFRSEEHVLKSGEIK